MKNLLFIVLLILISCQPSNEELQKRYDALNRFYDYETALEKAKVEDKPILIYFTAHGCCAGCPFIEEENLLGNKLVVKKLKDEFINLWLYVDDRTGFEEPYISPLSGKTIRHFGHKWADLQQSKFGEQSQPYFVIVNAAGEQISSKGIGYKVVRDNQLLDFLENTTNHLRGR